MQNLMTSGPVWSSLTNIGVDNHFIKCTLSRGRRKAVVVGHRLAPRTRSPTRGARATLDALMAAAEEGARTENARRVPRTEVEERATGGRGAKARARRGVLSTCKKVAGRHSCGQTLESYQLDYPVSLS